MKLAIVFATVSIMGVIAMIVQTLRQEINLRQMRSHMMESSMEVKKKENSIVEIKTKIKELKASLESATIKINELKANKEELENSFKDTKKRLETCNAEKTETDRKKVELVEATSKLKAEHEEAKNKAQAEIQNLKQQILDRDKTICASADMTKEEARKLCGVSEAPQ